MTTMHRYMSLARFRQLSVMPGPDIDLIESLESGWIDAQLDLLTAWLDSRLAKRYVTPFGADPDPPESAPVRSDVPMVIQEWLTALLTPRAYGKRGINPSSGELWFNEFVIGPYKQALADVKEAANSNEGWFDLPMRGSDDPAGIAQRGGPKGYSETSPYVWFDQQAEIAADEDEQGGGTVS